MGECSEGIAASEGSDGLSPQERSYDVSISPQEDRGGTAGKVGEGESREEEIGGLKANGA
jgi:hypothetical protein